MTETQLGEHWIDDVADRFEDAWRMDLRPLIEDYLNGDLKNCRAALLEELVCVDVHRRRRASEAPALAEYQARFPDDLAGRRGRIPGGHGARPADRDGAGLRADRCSDFTRHSCLAAQPCRSRGAFEAR